MEIRRAVKDDIDSLVELMERVELTGKLGRSREISVYRAQRVVKDDKRIILVFEDFSRLLGYVGISGFDEDKNAERFVDIRHYACINWVGVDPDFRHLDIGSRLVQSCDEIAKGFGKIGIWTDCREKVIPFYTGNGYEVKGCYDDWGGNRFVMAKSF